MSLLCYVNMIKEKWEPQCTLFNRNGGKWLHNFKYSIHSWLDKQSYSEEFQNVANCLRMCKTDLTAQKLEEANEKVVFKIWAHGFEFSLLFIASPKYIFSKFYIV